MDPGVYISLILGFYSVACQDVFVTVNEGTLRGRLTRVEDKDLEVYLGVPFAEPPVGERRFQRPVSPSTWEGPRDATWYGPACPQWNLKPQFNVTMDEDCLYLNVYTRSTSVPTLPVMVFIHGGTFLTGSGSFFDPSMLAVRDVVMVTINYRLNVLGFLSTEDAAAPGNFGMMDQVMALTWIRDNIAKFGGNPGDVTIMGYSAGSASVSLHLLSPLSRGLFHKVIAQSGSSLADWAAASARDNVSPRDVAFTLASEVNCTGSSSETVVACLRGVSADDIVNAGRNVMRPPRRLTWSPVIETLYGFLPDYPRALVDRGQTANVPVMIGVNKDESSRSVAALPGSNDGVNASVFRDKIFDFASKEYPEYTYTVSMAMVKAYLKYWMDPLAIRASYVNFLTDYYFTAPAILESELLTSRPGRRSLYFYRLAHRPANNSDPQWQGTSHNIGLLLYTFGVPIMGPGGYSWRWTWKWTEADKEFSRVVMNMTLNFILYGNPTPTEVGGVIWEPFTAFDRRYLYLDSSSVMKSDLRPNDMMFWNNDIPNIINEQVIFPNSASMDSQIPLIVLVVALISLSLQ
ncbi:neuroligin-4, X-linked-like [Haliotis rubra]|uniref:neuroligin-4, X-linked-like n=1 Tax=Haliotis rubra TaxID=36100 RepID=UPI001EE571A3|nr:neuroligin-4, X-linked-like [Haliotis rubra]